MSKIENLWIIYKHEKDLKNLLKDKSYLQTNENLEEIIVSMKEKEYDITNFKTQLEVDDIKIKRLNHKLKEITFELKEINTKLYSGDTTNVKKLTKLQEDEKDIKEKKEKLENEILELMEIIEFNTNKLYDSEKKHKLLNDKYNNFKKNNKIKINDIDKEYEDLENQIKTLKSSLDPEHLAKYEKLKEKNSKPISKLEDDKCRGCHMSIPSSVISKVKRGKEIVNCDNCGRILYYDQDGNDTHLK